MQKYRNNFLTKHISLSIKYLNNTLRNSLTQYYLLILYLYLNLILPILITINYSYAFLHKLYCLLHKIILDKYHTLLNIIDKGINYIHKTFIIKVNNAMQISIYIILYHLDFEGIILSYFIISLPLLLILYTLYLRLQTPSITLRRLFYNQFYILFANMFPHPICILVNCILSLIAHTNISLQPINLCLIFIINIYFILLYDMLLYTNLYLVNKKKIVI